MKRLTLFFSVAFGCFLAACGDSSLEQKIIAFEKRQPGQSTMDVEISQLKEAGNVTCSDSLKFYFDKNLSDTGLKQEQMVNWTPDSMISHYTKLIGFYKTSIGAFTYSASTAIKPDVQANHQEFVTRYKKELADDSLRLSQLIFFSSKKDSVIALSFDCLIKLNPGNGQPIKEINKAVVVSKDKTLVLGTSPKEQDSLR